ncbi:hypothetical protein ABRP55_20375 [Pectobacterium zantedeschiae]|uniref:hypothetical protein n=1 Tax=Pectobacterium zantedeschiae TaxID=2034769 RepID=UPI0032EBE7E5
MVVKANTHDGVYVRYEEYQKLEFMRDTFRKVMQDTADELGCNPDNEVILQAIDDLKNKVAELERQRDVLVDVLDSISVYGRDTLSGPCEEGIDRIKWYRDGVAIMTKRAQSKQWEVEHDA